MSVQRLTNSFDINNSPNYLIVSGTKEERFILPDLSIVSDDKLLWHHLRSNGYKRIYLYSQIYGLYTYDESSIEILGLSASETIEKQDDILPDGFKPSGFHNEESLHNPEQVSSDTVPVIKHTQDKFGRYILGHNNAELIEIVKLTFYSNPNEKKALIFTAFDLSFLSVNQEQAKLWHEFEKLISEQQNTYEQPLNKLIFIFNTVDEQIIINHIRQHAPILNIALRSTSINDFFIAPDYFIKINNPDRDEIENLINRYRLIYHKEIEWKNYDLIIAALLNKELKILELINLLNKLNFLCIKELNDKNIKIMQKSAEQRLAELVGLDNVKKGIKSFVKLVTGLRNDGLLNAEDAPRLHLMFTGNPGTGKTSVAKIVGEIFKQKKLVEGNKFTQVKSSQLIEEHVGGTQKRTREACENAMPGVMFIDEAYIIAESRFGKECVTELIQYMDDKKDKFAVIFAGYKENMVELFKKNDGLESRIGKTIDFDDYAINELMQIFHYNLKKKNLEINDSALEIARLYIEHQRKNNTKGFGNARGIEQVIQVILENFYNEREEEQHDHRVITEKHVQNFIINPDSSICIQTLKTLIKEITLTNQPYIMGIQIPQDLKQAVGYIEVITNNGDSTGTGFIINKEGYLITCFHVIENAKSVLFTRDGTDKPMPAEIVYQNAVLDFAILKLETEEPLPYFLLIDKDEKVDELTNVALRAYPLGRTLGLESGIWDGTVNGFRKDQNNCKFIQINVDATHGSSGGPVFRLSDGKIIGILSQGITNEDTHAASFNMAIDIRQIFDLTDLQVNISD